MQDLPNDMLIEIANQIPYTDYITFVTLNSSMAKSVHGKYRKTNASLQIMKDAIVAMAVIFPKVYSQNVPILPAGHPFLAEIVFKLELSNIDDVMKTFHITVMFDRLGDSEDVNNPFGTHFIVNSEYSIGNEVYDSKHQYRLKLKDMSCHPTPYYLDELEEGSVYLAKLEKLTVQDGDIFDHIVLNNNLLLETTWSKVELIQSDGNNILQHRINLTNLSANDILNVMNVQLLEIVSI